ncbi:MAG TPA: type II CAAX endopeptidase family protein [Paludibacter sp.]|jgi:membrane protease YdiL (CAAX protease family)|nr:CPBP family intramembrane metalloprotease [Bacteroidales bacterium]OQB29946.1 MAG: CAAX amino terminal protease self- immunity [Bacteroidetes bacterium ADurb.Bin174]HQB28201.1 type II CAAX endopeptidase family protein [Paludibacter sp.]
MKRTIIAILVVFALWFFMFSPWTASLINFWVAMSISALVLIRMSCASVKDFLHQFNFSVKEVTLGLVSAAALYGIFYLGNYLSTAWFDFAKPQIGSIYTLKAGTNPYVIGILLIALIAPAEEIFWRGFIQRAIGVKYGDWIAFFTTTLIYAFVHIWSFNFMLIMAALVCGAFWGLLFIYNKKNITALIISHAVWDVMVFIVVPIV